MVFVRGHNYNFPGLNLGFGKDKTLEVGMKENLEKALEDFGGILAPMKSLVNNDVFDADEN